MVFAKGRHGPLRSAREAPRIAGQSARSDDRLTENPGSNAAPAAPRSASMPLKAIGSAPTMLRCDRHHTDTGERLPLHFLMRKNLERIEELRRCLVLESSAEQAYDDITRLLATSLGVPMVMVSLLDEDRDWFKSAIGTPLQASPASTSFCEAFFHSGHDVILAEDTRLDPRFVEHPMVIGAPHVRFYAAARLAVNGQTVGTLCAYDFQPRQISAEQIAQLKSLAESAMDLLRRRLPSRSTG